MRVCRRKEKIAIGLQEHCRRPVVVFPPSSQGLRLGGRAAEAATAVLCCLLPGKDFIVYTREPKPISLAPRRPSLGGLGRDTLSSHGMGDICFSLIPFPGRLSWLVLTGVSCMQNLTPPIFLASHIPLPPPARYV